MAENGPSKTAMSEESSSPHGSNMTFAPANVRPMLQRQMRHTVDHELDRYANMSIGNFDGRYIANFPGKTLSMSNQNGNMYHIVGVSIGGDTSVAGP
jgi:hypothetical protein